MAKPVYMLCCEGQSVDVTTGLISHFSVFNSVQVAIGKDAVEKHPERGRLAGLIKLVASSTWMMEDGDDKVEFEFSQAIVQADDSRSEGPSGGFMFTKRFHRLDANIQGLPFIRPGIAYVEMRIRRVGTSDWITQRYPIFVEVIGEIPSDASVVMM